MIQIQLKDGRFYKTENIISVVLGNVQCLDFWHTNNKGIREREEIPVSKIDSMTSSAEESIDKMKGEVGSILGNMLGALHVMNEALKEKYSPS